MTHTLLRNFVVFIGILSFTGFATAAPQTYEVDAAHTYPSFEADHRGLSLWRGKINQTTGTIVLDKEAGTGSVDVTMDMASIDFGHEGMNESAVGNIFSVAEFPTASYSGELTAFVDGAPTAVEGELTLHGVTLPVNLAIDHFSCQPHYRTGIEVCGANATATFSRGDFGVVYGLEYGFNPEVNMRISIEANLQEGSE